MEHAPRRRDAALDGLSVLDASESVAGQFCARLLGDYGADVALAEPRGGSVMRRMGARGIDGETFLFRHLNAGKRRGIDLDDPAALAAAAATADVIVVGTAAHRDLCRAANPSAIVAVVTDFGLDGPLAGWRGSELIHQALSGVMPSNGTAGQPPLYGCGHRASYAAGLAAYCGVLAADLARGRSGAGQQVEVAVAEVAAFMGIGPVGHGYSGRSPTRRSGAGSIIRCGDDWVLLWCYPFQWADFCAALEITELRDDPRFAEHNTRAQNWPALLDILAARHRDTPADVIVARLRARRLITAKAQRLSTLRDDPHLRARGMFGADGEPAALAPPFRLSPLAAAGTPVASRAAESAAPPLAGMRVLDLTTAWAGPMAGRILAFFGADVIHLEHASKPDLWRHHRQVYQPALYAGSDADGPRHNRNALFNSQNVGKRSLSLDLKHPDGRATARRLAATCDVVLTNFTPGTLDRLGLGHAALGAELPRLVVCEMPAYGMNGPDSGALAVGATMEMASGMTSLIGYRGGPPTTTGPNYPDPIGGFNAAAAILTMLCRRARTGFGGHVELPQVEAAMQFIGAEILEAIETGRDPARDGNHVATHAPHNVYPARGSDRWLALSAPDDAAFAALSAIVDPALAADPRFATAEARLRHEDELDARLAAWSATLDNDEAAARLQAAGVAAAPVLDAGEVAGHPFFAARSSFVTLPHPVVGPQRYQTVPIRLDRTPGHDHSAGPCLGQHTDEILADIGLPAAEREALAEAGVTAAEPT